MLSGRRNLVMCLCLAMNLTTTTTVPKLSAKKAKMSDTPGPDHGHGPTRIFEAEEGPAWIPQVQAFSEHNGNEARQSYHGLPGGSAHLATFSSIGNVAC